MKTTSWLSNHYYLRYFAGVVKRIIETDWSIDYFGLCFNSKEVRFNLLIAALIYNHWYYQRCKTIFGMRQKKHNFYSAASHKDDKGCVILVSKGLAPYCKAKKNTRWNCPIWVQLWGFHCLLM